MRENCILECLIIVEMQLCQNFQIEMKRYLMDCFILEAFIF